jgi:hypothetical protein
VRWFEIFRSRRDDEILYVLKSGARVKQAPKLLGKFGGHYAPEVECFIRDVNLEIRKRFCRVSKFPERTPALRGLELEARKILRALDFRCFLSDKDGTWVLVRRHDVRMMFDSALEKSGEYTVVKPDVSKLGRELVTKHADVVAAFQETGMGSQANNLRRAFDTCERRLEVALQDPRQALLRAWCARVILNIKSHKVPGQVGVRTIHNATGTPTVALAKWISAHLRLYKVPTIVGGTLEFVQWAETLMLPEGVRLGTLDVDKFYPFPHGSPTDLSEGVRDFLEDRSDPYRHVLCTALDFVLATQFVQAKEATPLPHGRAYKSCHWGGIGVACIGEVCDVVNYQRVERRYLPSGKVQAWTRFRDDIFLAYLPPLTMQGIVASLGPLSKWKYGTAKSSNRAVDMLDTTVMATPAGGGVSLKTFVKPTSRGIPLSPVSDHPARMRFGWPLSECVRFAITSTHGDSYNRQVRRLLRRLKLAGFPAMVMRKVRFSRMHAERGRLLSKVRKPKDPMRRQTVVLALTHSAYLRRIGVTDIVRRHMGPLRAVWSATHFPKAVVAWRLPGRHSHVAAREW